MSALTDSTGQYLHAKEWKAEKTFETDGAPRRFTVLIAAAYNAGGLIGSEHNGIVILDDDNRAVVLDKHLCIDSGYHGPSDSQKAEFKKIMDMDWAAFSSFVRNHPRYRTDSVPDVSQDQPSVGRAEQSNHEIFGDDRRSADDPTLMPLRRRREIVEFLKKHHGHSSDDRGYDFCIGWNIKLHAHFDTSGKKHAEEFELDSKFDERWEQAVEKEDDMFWDAASSALSRFTEGEYATYPGDDQGRYEFGVAGRSGGHLVLTNMDGIDGPRSGKHNMVWSSRIDYMEWLEELPDNQLVDLYKLVGNVDQTVADRYADMEYQYAFQRSVREENWREEAAVAP